MVQSVLSVSAKCCLLCSSRVDVLFAVLLILQACMQAEVPEIENDLEAIVYFARTDDLRQKLLYLQCIHAAASAAEYKDAVDILVPLLEELGRDEDQPEEVRLEVAVQLAALGNTNCWLPMNCMPCHHSHDVLMSDVMQASGFCRQSVPPALASTPVRSSRLQPHRAAAEPCSIFVGR